MSFKLSMFVKPYLTLLLLNVLKNNTCYKNKQLLWNKYYSYSTNSKSSAAGSGSNYKMKNILKNKNYYEEEIDEKIYISNKKTTSYKPSLPVYEPRTENQKTYVDYLNDKNNNLIVVVGSAGTGKTMYSCLKAIELLKSKKIKKVIITRPVVSVEEDIGFLPGTIESKMDPYMRPILIFLPNFLV